MAVLQRVARPGDMAQGQVDAIAAWEPWASSSVARVPGSVRVTSAGCKGCYDPGTILTTRDEIPPEADHELVADNLGALVGRLV